MLNKEILRSYALIGAQARLAELDRERVDLLETFPELESAPTVSTHEDDSSSAASDV